MLPTASTINPVSFVFSSSVSPCSLSSSPFNALSSTTIRLSLCRGTPTLGAESTQAHDGTLSSRHQQMDMLSTTAGYPLRRTSSYSSSLEAGRMLMTCIGLFCGTWDLEGASLALLQGTRGERVCRVRRQVGSSCYSIRGGLLPLGMSPPSYYVLSFLKRQSTDIKPRTYVNSTARSSNDIEKGLTHASQQAGYRQNQPQEQQQQQSRSWRHLAWSLLRHSLTSPHGRQHHQQHLDHNGIHPETTVHTNAWAGMSRSRPSAELSPTIPSRKDFIRVRQEISQESELQEIV